jgi:murein DD-endopeptidase MepM/ murein hydrolase activator NlpD
MSRQLVVRRPNLFRPLPMARGLFSCSPAKVLAASAVSALMMAGCSADISRFDGQGYGLTDSASTKIPTQGMRRGESQRLGDAGGDVGQSPGGAYFPPSNGASAGNGVRVATLPDVAQPAPQQVPPIQPRGLSIAPRPQTAAILKSAPIAAGATIDVATGDTLYGLAKKHSVPVNELMTVNNLTTPTIKPGQKLVLPASRSIARAPGPQKPIQRAEPVRVAALPQSTQPSLTASVAAPAPLAAAPVPTNWEGSHTVKPGDSLYGIARANRTTIAQLQQVNGITDPAKVKPGTILKVPGSATSAALGGPAPAVTSKVAGAVASTETPRIIQSATKPVIINSAPVEAPQQVAAVDPVEPATALESQAAPKSKGTEVANAAGGATAGQKFRWPVKGRVIANYGPRSDSTHNDGVNIAVPMNTEVHAAETGIVAYAGSELKGYGNLILLRHDNGWVTAYAHNEEILVKRGDKVKRGQAIAKAGKTGTVDQPQVHFEIRQGQKPIDPLPHMEKL